MGKYLYAALLFFGSSCNSSNTSPCFLQATYDSGPASSFCFRDNGTFTWTSGGGMGVYETEGKYSLKDKVILLDKIGSDKVIKSKRLLLTTIQPNAHTVGKYLVQVDDQDKVIDSIFIFTVYLDNRNLVR